MASKPKTATAETATTETTIVETAATAATETAAPAAAAFPAVNLEQTVASLTEGLSKFSAGFEQSQAKLKEGMEKARKTAEDMVAFGQGNIEALTKSNQIWAAGVKELSQLATASMKASVEETVGVLKSLGGVKSLKEAIDLQSGFARNTLEKTVAETSRLTEASIKLTEEALAPLATRVNLAVEKFTKQV